MKNVFLKPLTINTTIITEMHFESQKAFLIVSELTLIVVHTHDHRCL